MSTFSFVVSSWTCIPRNLDSRRKRKIARFMDEKFIPTNFINRGRRRRRGRKTKEGKKRVQWQGGGKKKKAEEAREWKKSTVPFLCFTIREIKKQKPCIGGREDSFVIHLLREYKNAVVRGSAYSSPLFSRFEKRGKRIKINKKTPSVKLRMKQYFPYYKFTIKNTINFHNHSTRFRNLTNTKILTSSSRALWTPKQTTKRRRRRRIKGVSFLQILLLEEEFG